MPIFEWRNSTPATLFFSRTIFNQPISEVIAVVYVKDVFGSHTQTFLNTSSNIFAESSDKRLVAAKL